MRLGIDFDNTIVCYDGVFHAMAVRRDLIPPEIGTGKDEVRNYLRAAGREDDWTELQGEIYGAGMALAQPWPGVLDFFRCALKAGIPVFIVSHKTRHPFRGPRHDLHAAALGWLEAHGMFDEVGLPCEHVFFELTKEEKLARIAALGCSHFVDDLPEFLEEAAFPSEPTRLLFDPASAHQANTRHLRCESWSAITTLLLGGIAEA